MKTYIRVGRSAIEKYRPQVLSILAMGLGGSVAVGILYVLSVNFPDLIPHWPGGMLVFLLPWWIGGTIGVVCFGPFKVYAAKGTESRE